MKTINPPKLAQVQQEFKKYVAHLQDQIHQSLLDLDPEIELTEDIWERNDFKGNPGGGGRTRVYNGKVIENAGVNISQIHGAVDPSFAKQLGGTSDELWACGISLIFHPFNPKVPTVHMNFRMIVAGDKFWFGGGADLTPYYPHEEDFIYFHQVWKNACAPFGKYQQMKKDCDEYFVNRHREHEMRGVGGIFFDHFNTGNLNDDVTMVYSLADRFIESYFPIAQKRKSEKFNSEDEDFQLHRRGRYVEFNLIHDRGTLFGLKTNGRVDSILVSLPKRCKFSYRYQPKNAEHLKMIGYYKPKDWV